MALATSFVAVMSASAGLAEIRSRRPPHGLVYILLAVVLVVPVVPDIMRLVLAAMAILWFARGLLPSQPDSRRVP